MKLVVIQFITSFVKGRNRPHGAENRDSLALALFDRVGNGSTRTPVRDGPGFGCRPNGAMRRRMLDGTDLARTVHLWAVASLRRMY